MGLVFESLRVSHVTSPHFILPLAIEHHGWLGPELAIALGWNRATLGVQMASGVSWVGEGQTIPV